MTNLRPDNARAAQLRASLLQLKLDLEEAKMDDAPGAALFIHDLRQAIHETEHALFMTGARDD